MQQDNEAALQGLSGIFPSQSVIALCYPAYLLNGDNATETQSREFILGMPGQAPSLVSSHVFSKARILMPWMQRSWVKRGWV